LIGGGGEGGEVVGHGRQAPFYGRVCRRYQR
jgi:hypothetical protein